MCSSLLSKDPNNEVALLVNADLSFRRGDFPAAGNLFHRLLSQRQCYWLALVRMIEVKRRLGALKEAKMYLENAAAANDRDHSGLNYCTGE